MDHRSKWAVFALVAFLSSGCGTVSNFAQVPYAGNQYQEDDEAKVYGGVKRDWYFLTDKGWAEQDSPIKPLFNSLCAVDLPLSAVCDTLTLPYTVWRESQLRFK